MCVMRLRLGWMDELNRSGSMQVSKSWKCGILSQRYQLQNSITWETRSQFAQQLDKIEDFIQKLMDAHDCCSISSSTFSTQ